MLTVVVIVVAVGVARRAGRGGGHAAPAGGGRPRPSSPADESVRDAVARRSSRLRAQAAAERDAAVHAALEQAAVLSREQLGAAAQQVASSRSGRPGAKKDVIDTRLDQVRAEMRAELTASATLVAGARPSRAPSGSGRSTSRCAPTPRSPARSPIHAGRCARRWPTRRPAASGASGWPRTCCASPASSRTSTTASRPRSTGGTGRPDFTFDAAQGPRAATWTSSSRWPSYLRYLEAGTDAERQAHLKRVPARRAAAGQGAGQARLRPRGRPAGRSTTCCCSSPTSSSPASSTSTTRRCSTRRWASGS